MAKLVWIALAIIGWPCLCEGAKILVAFPFPSKSHNNLGQGLVRILLKAGHEVTYMTPFPNKKDTRPNLRYVDLSANVEVFEASTNASINLRAIIDKTHDSAVLNIIKGLLTDSGGFRSLINSSFSSKELQTLINDPNEKFDLIIIEWLFLEMYAGLAAVFDCPYIWFSSTNPHWLVLSLIDEVMNPAYNPDVMSANIPPYGFLGRAQELLVQITWGILRTFMRHGESKLYHDFLQPVMEKRGRQLPPFDVMIHNASLMLGSTHESIGWARRLPQNFKSIGGFHIDPDVKPLPEDLKKIIEDSKYGVIYFSLGSNMKSKDLPEEIVRNILNMFEKLKYTVIWKFEAQLSDVPKNVHILQWAPQPSILAHPKCKLFITHGGLLSTIETIYFGVPVIGIPIFADQFINVEIAKKKGYALRVDLSYQMADDLKIAIEEILSNPKYKQKIDELNLIFHDRPVTPDVELVHWVNHVIRTNGAPHLRSHALMMPWYQKMYLDFLAVVLIVIFIVVKAFKLMCCSSKKKGSLKNSDKKYN